MLYYRSRSKLQLVLGFLLVTDITAFIIRSVKIAKTFKTPSIERHRLAPRFCPESRQCGVLSNASPLTKLADQTQLLEQVEAGLAQPGVTPFIVRHASADEIKDLSWLIAGAFVPDEHGSITSGLRRWATWLQVYVGILDRIFASNFAQGLLLATDSADADPSATPIVAAQRTAARPHAVLIALDGATPVGAAELYTRPCPVPAGRVEAPAPCVCNLAVGAPRRGRGAARALLRACEAEAAAWGFEEVFLEADCANVAALRRAPPARTRPPRRGPS
jgi:ribosomal protein S18 acetylase RimI-like enzyme